MDDKILIQDLAEQLAEAEGLQKNEAQAFVRAFFDTIVKGLETDKYVKIKGLGTFKLVEVDSRESVNVNTGERFMIDGHSKISFAPDNALREMVNKPFAHFETVVLSDEVTEEELSAVDRRFEEEVFLGEEQEETVEELPVVPSVVKEKPVENPVATPIIEKPEVASEPEAIPIDDPLLVRFGDPVREEIAVDDVPVQPIEPEVVVVKPLEPEKVESTEQQEAESVMNSISESVADEQAPKEDSAPVQLPPPPVAPKRKHHKVLWAVLLCIALVMGYLLGHFNLFMQKNNTTPTLVHDTIYRQKIVHDTVKVETTDSAELEIAEPKQTVPQTVEKAKPSVQTPTEPKVMPVQTVATTPQVKGGAYEIVGTKETYTLRGGETIRIIAERYYGSREMATYIAVHNHISDPNQVEAGTVLNIPELRLKAR